MMGNEPEARQSGSTPDSDLWLWVVSPGTGWRPLSQWGSWSLWKTSIWQCRALKWEHLGAGSYWAHWGGSVWAGKENRNKNQDMPAKEERAGDKKSKFYEVFLRGHDQNAIKGWKERRYFCLHHSFSICRGSIQSAQRKCLLSKAEKNYLWFSRHYLKQTFDYFKWPATNNICFCRFIMSSIWIKLPK